MSKNKVFFRIENSDGKIWLMPRKNIKTAFELYQPSGFKGKLLKKFFPYLKDLSIVRSKLNITEDSSPLSSECYTVFKKIFGVEEPEISIFLGTPSVHQKTTIQIFKGNKVLGYAKISGKKEITDLFRKEKEILTYLASLGLKNIPKPLYLDQTKEGASLFIQDTEKTLNSRSPENWTVNHENFMNDLHKKSLTKINFRQSDLFQSIEYLKDNLYRIPEEIPLTLLKKTVNDILEEYSCKDVVFSVYHADFTPWNMFLNDEGLYVFDWEYSSRFYPYGLDKYHFHIQQWINVNHWDCTKIYEQIKGKTWYDPFLFKIYLTDIIARYLKREHEILSTSFIESIKLWVCLLQKTIEK